MLKVAKMTSHEKDKPKKFPAHDSFVAYLDECVEREFDGSYARLAAKSGVAEPMLSRMRAGRRAATAKTVGRIARAMSDRAGDRLIGHFLEVVRAEVEMNRRARDVVEKSRLYGRFL